MHSSFGKFDKTTFDQQSKVSYASEFFTYLFLFFFLFFFQKEKKIYILPLPWPLEFFPHNTGMTSDLKFPLFVYFSPWPQKEKKRKVCRRCADIGSDLSFLLSLSRFFFSQWRLIFPGARNQLQKKESTWWWQHFSLSFLLARKKKEKHVAGTDIGSDLPSLPSLSLSLFLRDVW